MTRISCSGTCYSVLCFLYYLSLETKLFPRSRKILCFTKNLKRVVEDMYEEVLLVFFTYFVISLSYFDICLVFSLSARFRTFVSVTSTFLSLVLLVVKSLDAEEVHFCRNSARKIVWGVD